MSFWLLIGGQSSFHVQAESNLHLGLRGTKGSGMEVGVWKETWGSVSGLAESQAQEGVGVWKGAWGSRKEAWGSGGLTIFIF